MGHMGICDPWLNKIVKGTLGAGTLALFVGPFIPSPVGKAIKSVSKAIQKTINV